jgi:hypothetical protein
MINENDRLEKPLRELQKLIWKIKKERNTKAYKDFINKRRRELLEKRQREMELLKKNKVDLKVNLLIKC